MMKIALINENSQAAKNAQVEAVLRQVVEPMGHEVYNYGMYSPEDACQLTYVPVSYTHHPSAAGDNSAGAPTGPLCAAARLVLQVPLQRERL